MKPRKPPFTVANLRLRQTEVARRWAAKDKRWLAIEKVRNVIAWIAVGLFVGFTISVAVSAALGWGLIK